MQLQLHSVEKQGKEAMQYRYVTYVTTVQIWDRDETVCKKMHKISKWWRVFYSYLDWIWLISKNKYESQAYKCLVIYLLSFP